MPLIHCPECEQEISDSAKACPHCGATRKQPPSVVRRTLITLAVLVALFAVLVYVNDRRASEKRKQDAAEAAERFRQEHDL